MSTGGTIDYFRNAVFNYPTLAEAYRVAALRGLWKVDRANSARKALASAEGENAVEVAAPIASSLIK